MDRMSIPTRETIERLADTLKEQRKSPIQSGNSEQGNSPEGQAQDYNTPSTRRSQENEFMRMFVQMDADDQGRVLRLMEAFASKDPQRVSWAWLVCRISRDTTGKGRKVALMVVEDGLKWREVAQKMGHSVRWCHKLYNKAMAQLNAS